MAKNYFGLTDTGKVRTNNEDTFVAQQTSSNLILACVIDGVGGYSGGEVAAAIARDEVIAQMDKAHADIIPAMVQAFRAANLSIYNRKQQDKELESMACVATLAMVDVENNQFYYAHVGDTRLYLLRDGSLVKISKDQSFVGFLEDSGRLTEAAAMSHPKRNEINKALGFNGAIDTDESYIDTGQSPFLSGDMLLLCSDGLSDLVDRNQITSIITQNTSLQQKAEQLIEAANSKGGKDNITVVLVQNTKQPQRPATTIPPPIVKKKESLTGVSSQPVQQTPLKQEPVNVVKAPVPAQKGNNGLTTLLGLLCLVFLASTIWFYLQGKSKPATVVSATDTSAAKKARSAEEVKLQQAIEKATSDTLVLADSVFKQAILITDSIIVQKDTLVIVAKGNITLKCDSTYHGPAFALSTNSKHVTISGLKLDGFATGIQVRNTALKLQKVAFTNCLNPVQNVYQFAANKPVTTTIPTVTYLTDTLKKTTAQPNGN